MALDLAQAERDKERKPWVRWGVHVEVFEWTE
jgi:hypothetical protein